MILVGYFSGEGRLDGRRNGDVWADHCWIGLIGYTALCGKQSKLFGFGVVLRSGI